MAKGKVTPIATARQAEPRTIPLSEIAITLPVHEDLISDPPKTVTIAGKPLAIMLAWLERTGKLDHAREAEWLLEEVGHDLRGLRDLLFGLSQASTEIPLDVPPVLRLLSNFAGDCAARLGAVGSHPMEILDGATVTLGEPATEAK